MIDEVWQWIVGSPTDRYVPVVIVGFLLGLASGISGSLWIRLRIIATWVHETGHAMAAIILGRDVTGITIHRNTSGVTNSIGRKSILQQSIVSFMGYPAPSLLGSLLLYLLLAQKLHLAIFFLIVLPILMLLLQRSLLGIGLTALGIVLAFSLVIVPAPIAAACIGIFAGYLIVASPRTIVELHLYRKRRGLDAVEHSDADSLTSLTGLPQIMWEVLFLCFSVGAPIAAVFLAVG